MMRVGVLRGGANEKYNDSLLSGGYILKSLPRDFFEPVDIYIDKEGVWHLNGKPLTYEKLSQKVDVIWNTLGGYYGADGQVQQLLENLGIPYVGGGPFASSFSMNKKMTKDNIAMLGFDTPQGLYVENWGNEDRDETASLVVAKVAEKFSPPWIVEPIFLTRSSGPIKTKTKNELFEVLKNAFELSIPVLIEEEIFGKELFVIAVSNFRNKPIYTFLPICIDNEKCKTYFHKSNEIQNQISDLHSKLNLGNYSFFKCILNNKGKLAIKGVETKPEFYPDSPLHHALKELGVTFEEFSKHLISEAVNKNKIK